MTIWFPIWAFWWILIPIVIPNYFVFIGVGPIIAFLTWRGYYLMTNNWKLVIFIYFSMKFH